MEPSERAIFAGDLWAAYEELHTRAAAAFTDVPPRHKAEALRRRALLLVFEGLEGWGVSLSRWVLQAASTGVAGDGQPASALLRECHGAISPSVDALIASARRLGSVRRADVHLAISQCCAHQRLWERLASRGGGADEFTRFMWRPLHFAAAVGAPATISSLLALGASPDVRSGVGLTPLHLAVAHGSAPATALLASTHRALGGAVDKYGRTPADYALGAAVDVGACCEMLRALGEDDGCRARCDAAIGSRERRRAAPRGDSARTGCATVDTLDAQSLVFDYLALGVPVLVTRSPPPAVLSAGWRRRAFSRAYGDVLLPFERYPYAEGSAGIYGDAINRSAVATLAASDEVGAPRKAPSEHPRSVFAALKGWERDTSGDELAPARGSAPFGSDAASSRRLLSDWRRPPCVADEAGLLRSHSVQFYLGGAGAGAQPHWHSTAWNWLAHGAKRWDLWPPNLAMYSQRHVRAALDAVDGSEGGNASAPLECEQRAGEVLIVPETWGHATTNLKQWSIGWATELQFDRTFDLGLGERHGPEWWRDTTSTPPSDAGGAGEAYTYDAAGAGGRSASPGAATADATRPRRRRTTTRKRRRRTGADAQQRSASGKTEL